MRDDLRAFALRAAAGSLAIFGSMEVDTETHGVSMAEVRCGNSDAPRSVVSPACNACCTPLNVSAACYRVD